MPKTIYKYPLDLPVKSYWMPIEAKIIALATQHGVPTLWCEVDVAPTTRMTERIFVGVPTGGVVEDGDVYLGTAHEVEGIDLVFHIYERFIE